MTWVKKQTIFNQSGEKGSFNFSKFDKRIFILIHRTDFGVTLHLEDKKYAHGDEENGIPTVTKDRVKTMYFDEGKNQN
ncbi:hypothetical protein BpHYR1_042912 [Brachionus plicatilis]|uniref:Uncharacterized protein n=1 Tax=Brachionus plicatilis TaxID=10195 RepID=A0A3M7T5E4_BRAPC|nr:hypothetical protein BpHYR1_042912 [Brachionus plicatilis]